MHCGSALAPGETVLWQGRPSLRRLAMRLFLLPLVACYFVVSAAIGLAEIFSGRATTAGPVLMPIATGAATVLIGLALAAAIARTTTYLITDRRVILRYGAALPRSLAIPFRQIASLDVRVGGDGTGDISLALKGGSPVPYLKLWPHVRPWRLLRPQIMLRDLEAAGSLASQLARKLAEADRSREPSPVAEPRDVEAPRAGAETCAAGADMRPSTGAAEIGNGHRAPAVAPVVA